MPTKPNRSNIKTTGRIVTAIVLTVMLMMVGWTAWFLYYALNSAATPEETSLSPAAAGAETMNTDLLDKIEKEMTAKVSRPVPRPEDLRNPFLIPVQPPAAPTAQPDEQPPAEEPPLAAEQPPAEEPPPAP